MGASSGFLLFADGSLLLLSFIVFFEVCVRVCVSQGSHLEDSPCPAPSQPSSRPLPFLRLPLSVLTASLPDISILVPPLCYFVCARVHVCIYRRVLWGLSNSDDKRSAP